MVLIDTSVWITLYRKRTHRIGELLWALTARNRAALCGQVWMEFIGGFRNTGERQRMAEDLAAFPWLDATRATFETAANILATYPNLGSGDAAIAAAAITHRTPLLTLDKDFLALKRFGLQLVEVA